MTIKADELVAEYLKLKETKEKIENFAKKKIDPISRRMNEIKGVMNEILNNIKQSSAQTVNGTFYRKQYNSVTVKDLKNVIKFIKDNNAFDLIGNKVDEGAALEYIEKGYNLEGINIVQAYVVNVRKC